MEVTNYYELLEINPAWAIDDIQKHLNKMAIKYHPDKQDGTAAPFIENMMKEINNAKAVFKSPEFKADYDRVLAQNKKEKAVRQTAVKTEPKGFFAGFAEKLKKAASQFAKRNEKEIDTIIQREIANVLTPKGARVSEDSESDSGQNQSDINADGY